VRGQQQEGFLSWKQRIIERRRIMRRKFILLGFVLLFIVVGCAPKTHFGVPDKAIWAPPEFGQTEAAIASAEKSPNAKYCPEKIAKAKAMGKQAAEIYWICRTAEAMSLLAQARDLAKEAESCQPPPPPPPPPPPAKVIPPPPPPPAPAAREPISFHSVNFDFDKSNLKPEAKVELDRAVKIMQDNPDVVLELQGNTDSRGTEAYNQALGKRRADAVFNYMKDKGIDPNRLKEVSFGEGKPVASNTTDAGRAQNRRVDLVIIK
jgi:outer membrane protein OmpA-like peptidoglycan-associated protein